jgi:taurine dioxygenase
MTLGARKINAFTAALGAEVCGIDVKQPLDEESRQFLREAWNRNLVIVLRGDVDVSADDQVRFCKVFGELGGRVRVEGHEPEGSPKEMMYISNLKQDGKVIGNLPDGEMQFHIDQCYTDRPAKGTTLYAIHRPSAGGDTMFANLYEAWETLPKHIKAAVEGRRAFHAYARGDYGALTRAENALSEDTPRASHPVVCTHPDTGRKLLYVSRLMTERIDGLPDDESEEILAFMFDHIEKPELRYVHQWRPGDLLLWDNRCTSHARTDFDPNEHRHLRRFTIRGEKTF